MWLFNFYATCLSIQRAALAVKKPAGSTRAQDGQAVARNFRSNVKNSEGKPASSAGTSPKKCMLGHDTMYVRMASICTFYNTPLQFSFKYCSLYIHVHVHTGIFFDNWMYSL